MNALESGRQTHEDALNEAGVDSGAQLKAIKASYALAARLVQQHPEIADIFLASGPDMRLEDIAGQVIPHEVEISRGVATTAVGKALVALIPEEQRLEKMRTLRSQRLEKAVGGYGTEEHREHQRRAALARSPEHSDPSAMIRANGNTLWTNDERKRLLELVQDPAFQHQDGRRNGTPYSKKIAHALNGEFHEFESIRTREAILRQIYDIRRRNYTID